jgi:phage shock protein E
VFAQRKYRHISPSEVKQLMDKGEDVLLVDVRTLPEYMQRHIAGSVHLPLDDIRHKHDAVLPDKTKAIIVYCLSGARSARAASELAALGYANIADMGGINAWPYGTV